jgi:hypothetical protein
MSKVAKAKTVVKTAKAASGKEMRSRRGGRASVRGRENMDGIGRALWAEKKDWRRLPCYEQII